MQKSYETHLMRVSSQHIINYTYLIVDQATKQAAIIDPAWELQTICNKLDELGVELVAILLTHSHFDHVNLVPLLVLQYGAQVYMGAKEILYYQFKSKNLNPLFESDVLKIGETLITCLSTPGHTAGGFCYLLDGDCFTGDTVFTEGIGVCDLAGGCPEEMYYSIQRLKQEIRHDVRIYPGHSFGKSLGQPFSELIKNNIYFLLGDKEHFIRFRMRVNQKNNLQFL